MHNEDLEMTTTIPQPCSIDFVRPLRRLEHFFSLVDQHRAVHFAMAAQIEGRTTISKWRSALDNCKNGTPCCASPSSGCSADFRCLKSAAFLCGLTKSRGPLSREILATSLDSTVRNHTAEASVLAEGFAKSTIQR
jgi:hypothetical protein